MNNGTPSGSAERPAAPGIVFADTSVLVKALIEESGSEAVRDRFRSLEISVSTLTWAEMHATLARRRREGSLGESQYQAIVVHFDALWNGFVEIGLDQAVQEQIPTLVRKYPLRAGDAVQLASAVTLRDAGVVFGFATADRRLAWAAEAEGLQVWGVDVVDGASSFWMG
jgi:predicted nucleic acid-binding protein